MKRDHIILLGIIGLGVFLRLFNLDQKSLWTDELVTINNAVDLTLGGFFSHTQYDDLPKFYSLLLKLWMLVGSSAFWLRSFSAICGVLAIPVTYKICRLFFDEKVSLIAALLTAASPFLLLYDREIRMYPLFVLFSLLSTYYFISALRTGKKTLWLLYVIINILNLYTHYYAFLTLGVQWLYLIIRFKDYKQYIKPWLVANLAIFSVFMIRISAFIADVLYHAPWALPRERFPFIYGKEFVEFFYILFSFSAGQTLLPWNPVGVVLYLAMLALFLYALKKEWSSSRDNMYLVLLVFTPLIVGLIFRIAMPRYFTFVAPIFFIFIARGITLFPKKMMIVGVIILTLGWTYSLSNYYTNKQFHIMSTTDPWREVGDFLKNEVKSDEVVYVVGIGVVPLRYYYRESLEEYGGEELLDKVKLINESSTERMWLIFSYQEEYQNWLKARNLLSEKYQVIDEKKWSHDPDYKLKRKLFRRNFAPHRIVAELYERNN